MSWPSCRRKVPILLLLLFAAWPSPAQASDDVNVESKVQVRFSGYVLNRRTNTFDTLATIQNTSPIPSLPPSPSS